MAPNNSYAEFNDKYYKQTHGLLMGSCLSAIIADLYIDDYINKYLNKINIPQKIWRYVNDVIIITTMSKNELNNYVEELNNIRNKIKFTSEFEDSKKLNFLGTTITRSEDSNKINIRWYRRPTASNTLLNHKSCHHRTVITNIVSRMTSMISNTSKNTLEQKEDIKNL